MLDVSTNPRRPGFRALLTEEIALIAGGNNATTDDATTIDDVVVTGERDDGDDYWWYDYDFGGDDYNNDNDYTGGGVSGGDSSDTSNDTELSAEEEEGTKETIQALISMLDENIKKYGDSLIKLPNGLEVKASDLLDALGKTLDIIEAGQLGYEVATGDGDVAAVAGFLAGLLGGAVAGALGAGPIAVFAAGFAAGWMTEYAISEIIDQFNADWAEAWQNEINQNPTYTPGMHQLYMIMQMFGYTGPPPSVGGGTYIDQPGPNYGGPGYQQP